MNGAEALLRTAARSGIDVCFANPGTTELALIAALDRVPEIRPVLCLFEGVATGAADGYARMAGRPALTLIHQGPSLLNGGANLHNARRARSPLVNLIGAQPTWHERYESPLRSDIVAVAQTVSDWVRSAENAANLPALAAEAIAVATEPPGRIASLIVPADCQWEAAEPSLPVNPKTAPLPDPASFSRAIEALVGGSRTALILGGHGTHARGLRAAARIAARTGCRLMCETFPARLERGRDLPSPERVPYVPERAALSFRDVDRAVLAGAADPVATFGYRGGSSRLLPPHVSVEVLARPNDDVARALEEAAGALGARVDPPARKHAQPAAPSGALDGRSLAAAIASVQPEGAIIVDEGVSLAGTHLSVSDDAPPHTYLSLTGGATGFGIPCATGAAIACPDRRVITIEGDGSALYTIQALWTQARLGLDVVTVLCANDGYRILQIERARLASSAGDRSASLFELRKPPIDWISLARGFGVPSSRVSSADELVQALRRALAERGPHLIEARLAA